MTQSTRDPELARLLVAELERHLVTLDAGAPDREACQRALHALKGSAGLTGERDLASALQRFERRVHDGDDAAITDAAEVVRVAATRLRAGESAIPAAWPTPPNDLGPSPIDPIVHTQYVSELADRLAQIDEALASVDEPEDVVLAVYRHVHTMKGAASAVGDEAVSWFCHGLEERLKRGTVGRELAVLALEEVARSRPVLGGLLEDPGGTLASLRAGGGRRRVATSIPSARGGPSTIAGGGGEESTRPSMMGDESTIRVPAASIDRLIDELAKIDTLEGSFAAEGEHARDAARRLRGLRVQLAEALRLIGPPRPWGAPAAAIGRIEAVTRDIVALGELLEQSADALHAGRQSIRESGTQAHAQVSAMRRTPLRRLFARVASAVESEARRTGRTIVVRTRGGDETVDRRLAEALVEPLLTLARNAVAHGIEPGPTREFLGKPAAGTLTITAVRVGHRLVLTLADDGAGVDIASLRTRAVESGAVSTRIAEAADDDTLLGLLFLPGFSTRDSADLLAGRGIGLDIALGAVQRMGGVIRLATRYGEGFEARIDVPADSGLASVLWVTAAGIEHAFFATQARRVRPNDAPDADRVAHLAACLEPRPNMRAALAVELDTGAGDPLVVGVDAVGRSEVVLVRPLTPLVAAMGPFGGAIARGDGTLRLAIDATALAPRVRALGSGR